MLPLVLLLLALPLRALSAARGDEPSYAALVGWWSAEPEHDGERCALWLRLAPEDAAGRGAAHLTIPAIEVFDTPLGPATLAGRALAVEPLRFELALDAAGDELSGLLPEALVPVHEIEVRFRRSGPPPERRDDPPPPAPDVLWERALGSPVWAGLALDADGATLFAGSDDGALRALSAATGDVLWELATGGAVRATPTLLGERVLVASDDGTVRCADARSGAELWSTRIGAAGPPRLPSADPATRWDRYASSVVADGDHLFVGSRDGHLVALDGRTGAVLWRAPGGDLIASTPVALGDAVCFASFDGRVRCVARADGALRWERDLGRPVPGDLVAAGGRVLAGSRSYDLVALEPATGRTAWSRYLWFSWIESPPAPADGAVYHGSSDALAVYARAAATGELLWRCRVPGWSWSRPAVSADLVVAGTVGRGGNPGARRGSLAGIDRASGALRWLLPSPAPQGEAETGFAAAPVVAGDTAFAADLDGRVLALALRSAVR